MYSCAVCTRMVGAAQNDRSEDVVFSAETLVQILFL